MSFFSLIPSPARILVLDLGFLGDTVHLIPALAAIRRALPQARLEVMVAEHVKEILVVCPWLDDVRGYPRFPAGPRWYQDMRRVRALRAEKFDAVINLNGSDRSSILTWLTGTPLRLGRTPPKTPWFWRHCFTHAVSIPCDKPVYRQRLNALAAAGFPMDDQGPLFPIEIPAETTERVRSLLGSERPFTHVSPFTTQDEKELPMEVLAEFLNGLNDTRPDLGIVLSIAPTAREQSKLATLRERLTFEPSRVFAGNLDLVELAAVLQQARLHLGGDSGALHVALMAGTPTLSWWRDYPGRVEWMPDGAKNRAVLGETAAGGLQAIRATKLLGAATDCL